jgi:hypothetical protein
MNPVSALKSKTAGAEVVSLVSYLETDNERLRRTAAELSLQTTALRQELDRMERSGPVAGAED